MWEMIIAEFTPVQSAVAAPVAALRLCVAVVLGAVIGIEREWRRKAAGLRTHILVSVAACLFVILGLEISALDFGTAGEQRNDPLRMIEAVTAGVAFLAAGTIFTAKGEVKNVTTGASLWLAGAVGLGCGTGQELLAAMATVIVVAVLGLLRLVERDEG
ncbi:MgtC/SapB family protein [Cereibacter sphaeroides]|nr:MgtC/SapB family protein [Cereibacter sphaeroides]